VGRNLVAEKADSLHTAEGTVLYLPSLTGLGERANLSLKETGFQASIDDVVNAILFFP
jgi:hypothetical protein